MASSSLLSLVPALSFFSLHENAATVREAGGAATATASRPGDYLTSMLEEKHSRSRGNKARKECAGGVLVLANCFMVVVTQKPLLLHADCLHGFIGILRTKWECDTFCFGQLCNFSRAENEKSVLS